MKLALLAHWDEFRKGSTHCGLFVLTQAFDCYSKGGKKVAEVPPSSPLPAGTVPSTGHRAQEVRKGWAPEEQMWCDQLSCLCDFSIVMNHNLELALTPNCP